MSIQELNRTFSQSIIKGSVRDINNVATDDSMTIKQRIKIIDETLRDITRMSHRFKLVKEKKR